MNKTIRKFPLKIVDFQLLNLPLGSEILSVQNQNETPCIWALVDPTEKLVETKIVEIYGTGHPIERAEERKFIGTILTNGDMLVWHIFLWDR